MELYGQESASNGSKPQWARPEYVQSMSLWGRDAYPERSGMPDCAYYTRTGVCGYGAKCRYNHPRDLASVGKALKLGAGEYPQRIGELPCQYYLRTGTCKFGATCKFHHPRDAGGSLSIVSVNVYGYPLRPGEKECSYYLKTGQCKFGRTCKFHHPQPAGMSLPATARPFYPTVQTFSAPSAEQYGGPSTSYRVARPPMPPGSYVPGVYGPTLLHPGVLPVPNWNTYMKPVGPALSPGSLAQAGEASQCGMSQLATSATSLSGTFISFPSQPASSIQKQNHFPVKPGQPECQYYMKSGDCKFGSNCKYHHPPEVLASKMNLALSPLGLPLRPGLQACSFYLHKGRCKFGLACKFDHPMSTLKYSQSVPSADVPVATYMLNYTGHRSAG